MLYIKKRIFDEEKIRLLLHEMKTGRYKPGAVTTGGDNVKTVVDKEVRKVDIHSLNVLFFPDISNDIVNLGHELLPEVSTETHFAKELQILKYPVGGMFKKHNDTRDYDIKPRLLTCVTLLKKSDDLEGGDLLLWQNKKSNKAIKINLKPYETVIFRAKTFHECTKVIKGERNVLISWVHEFERSKEFFEQNALHMNKNK